MSVTKTESEFDERILEKVKDRDKFSFTQFKQKDDKPDYIEFECEDRFNTYYIRCKNASYLDTPVYKITAPPMTMLSNCDVQDVLEWIENK